MSKIEGTGWNNYLRNIISTSSMIAQQIHKRQINVVVHWSDGWDRTAQLWSLSEMFLDPYYRTLEGFEVIIEKEWISFGHKFNHRSGHFSSDSHLPDERSPVFIQFLDWVHQILSQFPTAFQFNQKLLLFLAHHVYTCKFGTFLYDNDRSRFKDGTLKESTVSIWTYVNDNCYDFINPYYNKTTKLLEPTCDTISFRFWREHFLQWNDVSDYMPDLNWVSPDDHKEEIMKDMIEENMLLKKRIAELEDQLKSAKAEITKL